MKEALAVSKHCPECRLELQDLDDFHRVHADGIIILVSTLPDSELQDKIDDAVKQLLKEERKKHARTTPPNHLTT